MFTREEKQDDQIVVISSCVKAVDPPAFVLFRNIGSVTILLIVGLTK